MSVFTPDAGVLRHTRTAAHAACFLCGASNPAGLKLDFVLEADGSVHADVPCPRTLQSYEDTLHGGVVAALLDAAMTNGLFALGVVAVTARLSVRYVQPVRLDIPARVAASVDRNRRGLFYCSAELTQNGRVAARASATFVTRLPIGSPPPPRMD